MPRHENYVSPADGELPRLQPLARLEPVQPLDLDAAQAFARPGMQTHETTDPVRSAFGFAVKYAALSAILLILTIGVTIRLKLGFDVGTIVFALLATGAYWILAIGENWFTGAGVERHRLTVGAKVLTRQIEADERVRLAQIRLQRRHLDAQREMNAYTIQAARERAQAQLIATETPIESIARYETTRPPAWDIHELEPPRFAQRGTQTLRTDPARQAVLDTLIALYDRGDDGQWVGMNAQGYIHNSMPLPWGKRGGHSQTERRQMLDLLHRSRVACFDDTKRAWRVSVKLFPTAEDAILAIGSVSTVG